jgi:hypothetical protein
VIPDGQARRVRQSVELLLVVGVLRIDRERKGLRGTDDLGDRVLLVVALGLLLVVGVHAPDRRLWGALDLRIAGVLLLALPVLVMALVAVPFNLTVVDDTGLGTSDGVQVRGYSVTYAEGVTNPKATVLNVSVLGASTTFRTGGVIVANPQRQLWVRQVSPGQLAFTGTSAVRVGGLTWEEVVFVQRRGWKVRGGGAVYRVRVRERGGRWRSTFRSRPATAGVTIAGRNVTLVPANRSTGGFEAFRLVVHANNRTLGRTRLPVGNQTVGVGGLRFERRGRQLIAVHNRTRIPIARRERYR